tara:strand:- start:1227 stop:1343 length:117 start_codon:yes stop_codon:yes gene_type:complete
MHEKSITNKKNKKIKTEAKRRYMIKLTAYEARKKRANK